MATPWVSEPMLSDATTGRRRTGGQPSRSISCISCSSFRTLYSVLDTTSGACAASRCRCAASMLEASPDDIVLGDRGAHVAGVPDLAVSYEHIAAHGAGELGAPLHDLEARGGLDVGVLRAAAGPAVEVDRFVGDAGSDPAR